MESKTIRRALAALGKRLARDGSVETLELLVVGGAAGLLSGELAGTNTTSDVDVLLVGDWDRIQDAAASVGIEMNLPANWLNNDAGLYAESLPADWKTRRMDVGCFGALQVWAVGRKDLIAMKFYSHRPQDREHLAQMNVTPEEREFVNRYLDDLAYRTGWANAGKIEMSRQILKNWE
jgi:Nucleotidyltransferase of unknown function (DUF6036)